jgi:hypothetical protein
MGSQVVLGFTVNNPEPPMNSLRHRRIVLTEHVADDGIQPLDGHEPLVQCLGD